MPLFDEGGHTGAHYQTAWQALTGLFDPERRKKPNPHEPDEDDDQPTQDPIHDKDKKNH